MSTIKFAPIASAVPMSRASVWAGRVLSGLFVAFMLFDILIKLLQLEVVAEAMTRLGWSPGHAPLIGVLELVFVGLYLWRPTAVLGAVLLKGIFGGAVATHLRIGDPLVSHTLFGVYLGAFAWGGLWLRDAQLRALAPWRQSDVK